MRNVRALLHLLLGLLWLSQSALALAVPVAAMKTSHEQHAGTAVATAEQDLPPCHRQAAAEAAAPKQAAPAHEAGCDCCGADSTCVHASGSCPMATAGVALPSVATSWSGFTASDRYLPVVEPAIGAPDPGTLLRPPSLLPV